VVRADHGDHQVTRLQRLHRFAVRADPVPAHLVRRLQNPGHVGALARQLDDPVDASQQRKKLSHEHGDRSSQRVRTKT
jgi:hypothetical protein